MELLPITINAKRGMWRLYNARKRNNKFLAIKKRVLQRDNYTCRYCGFFAKEFQDVVNTDMSILP